MERPNLNYIKALSNGELAFEKKLINIIKDEFPQEKELYEKHIAVNNYNAAADVVHKIKHKITVLGLEKSYEIASEYEKNLFEGDDSKKDKFNVILETITNFIKDY